MSKNCVGQAVPVIPDISVKRFYIRGASLEYDCPNCGAKQKEGELDGDSINYPSFSRPYEYGGYCDECDTDIVVLLHFKLTVRAEIPE
jgi:hypothetical protein